MRKNRINFFALGSVPAHPATKTKTAKKTIMKTAWQLGEDEDEVRTRKKMKMKTEEEDEDEDLEDEAAIRQRQRRDR